MPPCRHSVHLLVFKSHYNFVANITTTFRNSYIVPYVRTFHSFLSFPQKRKPDNYRRIVVNTYHSFMPYLMHAAQQHCHEAATSTASGIFFIAHSNECMAYECVNEPTNSFCTVKRFIVWPWSWKTHNLVYIRSVSAHHERKRLLFIEAECYLLLNSRVFTVLATTSHSSIWSMGNVRCTWGFVGTVCTCAVCS